MAKNIDVRAGQAVAAVFLTDAKGAKSVGALYTSFLATLETPEAKAAFDAHVVSNDRPLADSLGIPAKLENQTDTKRGEYFDAVIAALADRKTFFSKYLGAEAVDDAVKSFGGEVRDATHVEIMWNQRRELVALIHIDKKLPSSYYSLPGSDRVRLACATVVFSQDGTVKDFKRTTPDEYRATFQALMTFKPSP